MRELESGIVKAALNADDFMLGKDCKWCLKKRYAFAGEKNYDFLKQVMAKR